MQRCACAGTFCQSALSSISAAALRFTWSSEADICVRLLVSAFLGVEAFAAA